MVFVYIYVIEYLEVISNDSLDIDWDGLNLERKQKTHFLAVRQSNNEIFGVSERVAVIRNYQHV